MKDWQKHLLIVFCPLLVFLYFFIHENKKAEVAHKPARTIASLPKGKDPADSIQKTVDRKVSASKVLRKKNVNLLNRIPQSIEDTFQKNEKIKISAGYEFIEDVAAIPKNSFDPSLGSVIKKDDSFVYFRTNPGHSFIPVAISKSTNLLYPISSVLHVKDATQEIRSNLLNKGFTEYYYHPPLKFLSLKAQAGEVVKVYYRLKNDGYKVELEVLKPGPQAF